MALDIFIMSDQPETCRQCGTRTEFADFSRGKQIHECSNCYFTYWLEDGTVPCVNCSSTDVMEDVFDGLLNDIPSVWCKSCGTLYHRDEDIILGNIAPTYVLGKSYE
ncbi:MAG: hypothetical protein EHM79_10595 [Geobacter sp.]|nr:MAG: hypothetical protein EHM79_10595 [Geobacter sp.]